MFLSGIEEGGDILIIIILILLIHVATKSSHSIKEFFSHTFLLRIGVQELFGFIEKINGVN